MASKTAMPQISLQDVEKKICELTQCVKAGSELLDAINTITFKAVRMIDDAVEKVDAIKHTEAKVGSKVHFCSEDLKAAAKYSLVFVNKVDDLYWYCSRPEELARIKKDCLTKPNPDLTSLKALVAQLQRSLVQAEQARHDFESACSSTSKSSAEAAEECRHQAIRAQSKKRATRAVGGTVATMAILAGVGGGITASAIAGAFTFGIGAIVGLTLTACAVGAAAAGLATGVGTAIVTGVIAKDLADTEKGFKEIQSVFDRLIHAASSIKGAVDSVHIILLRTSTLIEDVENHTNDCQNITSLIDAVELLWKRSSGAYNVTSCCRVTMKNSIDKLEGKI